MVMGCVACNCGVKVLGSAASPGDPLWVQPVHDKFFHRFKSVLELGG